jgi:S-adenosylmethionine/arginine decarboxylase-like enzyme
LAIDCFTCGGTNAEGIVEDVLNAFTSEMPDLVVHQRAVMNRFLHPEEG